MISYFFYRVNLFWGEFMIFPSIEYAIRHELLVISLIPATRVTSLSVLGKTMGPKAEQMQRTISQQLGDLIAVSLLIIFYAFNLRKSLYNRSIIFSRIIFTSCDKRI